MLLTAVIIGTLLWTLAVFFVGYHYGVKDTLAQHAQTLGDCL